MNIDVDCIGTCKNCAYFIMKDYLNVQEVKK